MAALTDASMKALLEEYTPLSDAPFPSAELKAEIKKYDRLITKHKGESPDWGSLPIHEATAYTNVQPKNKADLRKKYSKFENVSKCAEAYRVQIAKYPFSRGEVRLAYKGRLQHEGGWIDVIFKQFISPHNRVKKEYFEQLETNGVAKFLAEQYMVKHPGKLNISCISCHAVYIETTKTWYNMEQALQGTFGKWTNNAGYCCSEKSSRPLLEFSKWSYEWTDGFMMVTDLQGCAKRGGGWSLTDPAVLCKDLDRFGPTNYHVVNMKICYDACKHTLRTVRGRGTDTRTSYRSGFSKEMDRRTEIKKTSLSRSTPRRAGESKKTSLLSLVPPPRPVETKPEPRRDPDAASRKGGWWAEEGPFTGRDGRGVFCARPHGFGIPFGGIPVGGIPLGEYGRPSGRGGHHLLEVDKNGWYL